MYYAMPILILDQSVFTLENTVGFQPNRNTLKSTTKVHWKR